MKKRFAVLFLFAIFSCNLFSRIGYVNMVVVMAFHPLMSNYNINMHRFYRDIKADSAQEYQLKLQKIKKNVSEELKKVNKKNKQLMYLIRKQLSRLDEAKRYRFQAMIKAKEDYENMLKGIKPYEFPKVEFTEEEKDKKKEEKIKLTVPDDTKKKKPDPEAEAGFFAEYRKQCRLIEKTFKKRVADVEVKIDDLQQQIENGFEHAYRELLLDKAESQKMIRQIRQDVKKAIAFVAKKNKIELVLNSSNEFLNDFSPEQNMVFNKEKFYDYEKKAMEIMNDYNRIIDAFDDSHPLSKKSRIKGKKMKKGNLEKHRATDEEYLYLEYENWFETLEKWFEKSVKDYKKIEFNDKLFLSGGTDLTANVLKELLQTYKINPVLVNDIVNYIRIKNR